MQFKWKCIYIDICSVYKWETENNICITSKRKYIRGYSPDIEYKSWSSTVLLCMGLVIHLTKYIIIYAVKPSEAIKQTLCLLMQLKQLNFDGLNKDS